MRQIYSLYDNKPLFFTKNMINETFLGTEVSMKD